MTGHKMLIGAQNIPMEFLGNGHRGIFWLQDRLICFIAQNINWF